MKNKLFMYVKNFNYFYFINNINLTWYKLIYLFLGFN